MGLMGGESAFVLRVGEAWRMKTELRRISGKTAGASRPPYGIGQRKWRLIFGRECGKMGKNDIGEGKIWIPAFGS